MESIYINNILMWNKSNVLYRCKKESFFGVSPSATAASFCKILCMCVCAVNQSNVEFAVQNHETYTHTCSIYWLKMLESEQNLNLYFFFATKSCQKPYSPQWLVNQSFGEQSKKFHSFRYHEIPSITNFFSSNVLRFFSNFISPNLELCLISLRIFLMAKKQADFLILDQKANGFIHSVDIIRCGICTFC